MRQKLALALRQARLRKPRKEDMQVGTGTNENGPQLEAPSYPANYWPSDSDHS
jgi:hypothetical protein